MVWVGAPTTTEQSQLEKAGWAIRVTDAMACTGVGRRRDVSVVAVVDLRLASHADAGVLDHLIIECANVPWVALVSPETVTQHPLVSHILGLSRARLSAPLDMAQMIEVLTSMASVADPVPDDLPVASVPSARSPAMKSAITLLRKYALVNLPVLITGETGTGKERVALALHRQSLRRDGAFVAINCGALSPSLLQAELFGHERGAFTGAATQRIGHIESAAGGTVLLDEVGDLPHEAQIGLLRFLQEGTIERVGSSQPRRVDARVVAATHVDLERAVADGRFREDLYYRLNVLRLRVPALRDREADIEPLARHFLKAFRAAHGVAPSGFTPAALLAMRRYAWPGNVRELENLVQRAAVIVDGGAITERDLGLPPQACAGVGESAGLVASRGHAERDALVGCLRETGFNVSECARRLHISRVSVYRLCRKHGLTRERLF